MDGRNRFFETAATLLVIALRAFSQDTSEWLQVGCKREELQLTPEILDKARCTVGYRVLYWNDHVQQELSHVSDEAFESFSYNRPCETSLQLDLVRGCVLVSALYFPFKEVSVSLPELEGVPRPLPPLLRLHAVHAPREEIKYGLNATGSGKFFQIRQNELLLNEEWLPDVKNGHYAVEVYGQGESGETASATVDVFFTDRKLVCDNLRKEMCFWTEGRFRIARDQAPTTLAYLSSEFVLSLCANYSAAYHVASGQGYIGVGRTTNTNAGSWILFLDKSPDPDETAPVKGEVVCSVSPEDGPVTVYGKQFVLDVVANETLQPERKIPKPMPKDLKILSLVVTEEKDQKITVAYPKRVNISKFATASSRVAEPIVKFSAEVTESTRASNKIKLVSDSGIKFRIEPGHVFGITEVGGIVYVLTSANLQNSTTLSAAIVWSYPNGYTGSSLLLVNVSQVGGACEGKSNDLKNRKSCSQKTSESECVQTCGFSSGLLSRNASSGCQWRDNDKPERLSVSYRTCSPDLRTCPDRFCDPLERLFPDTCPQDCAEYVYGSANKDMAMPGISSASGVCSCGSEDGRRSCTCDLLGSKKRQGKGRKFKTVTELPLSRHSDANVSVVQAAYMEHCGMACLSLVVGGSVLVIFMISTFFMFIYHRRLKKRCPNQGPLKEDMININYEEYIDRTAEGLRSQPLNPVIHEKPDYYDKKWEFPRYRLTVEETLGEGEFGKVLKAKAEGIGGNNGPTTVAVKTLKENAKDSELTDLISEYQLLKEVDHPNIIHLLGACTTLDGPLYVIIEYAKHGSLRNYLRQNRNYGSELQLSDKESETSYVQSITPKDILTFAWQIAKGMAYLTEMKLVHRDLAARNVLVAEGLICKISDFGLTRDIYEDDTYLKRSKGRVPVKWMALESLSDHIYTTKSDVWSYGIVLWELVTTGASPYPGIAVQNLFHLLKSGYRMEKPVNCSPELYQILRSCWQENPTHRPTFKSLVSKLEEMLGEGKDYLDLNPSIIENKTYFTDLRNEDGAEEGSFLPERKVFKWKFDLLDVCGCRPDECTCRTALRYENENAMSKLRYENDEVSDASYVQPKGEPKPVNMLPLKSDTLSNLNLCSEGDEKEFETKQI